MFEPLVEEVTALQTEPQTTPYLNLYFAHALYLLD